MFSLHYVHFLLVLFVGVRLAKCGAAGSGNLPLFFHTAN